MGQISSYARMPISKRKISKIVLWEDLTTSFEVYF